MAINLKEMSRKELMALQGEIEKLLRNLHKKEKKDALVAAQKAAASFGFSLDELTSKRASTQAAKGSSLVPKYANPEDSTQTWTGKGRQPNWFKAAISSGKSAKDLEI